MNGIYEAHLPTGHNGASFVDIEGDESTVGFCRDGDLRGFEDAGGIECRLMRKLLTDCR